MNWRRGSTVGIDTYIQPLYVTSHSMQAGFDNMEAGS